MNKKQIKPDYRHTHRYPWNLDKARRDLRHAREIARSGAIYFGDTRPRYAARLSDALNRNYDLDLLNRRIERDTAQVTALYSAMANKPENRAKYRQILRGAQENLKIYTIARRSAMDKEYQIAVTI